MSLEFAKQLLKELKARPKKIVTNTSAVTIHLQGTVTKYTNGKFTITRYQIGDQDTLSMPSGIVEVEDLKDFTNLLFKVHIILQAGL